MARILGWLIAVLYSVQAVEERAAVINILKRETMPVR